MEAKHPFVAEISLLAHKWLQFHLFLKKRENSKSSNMVIVSNKYKIAFRSYSLFSTEMLKTASSGIYQYKEPCLHPLRKKHITDDSRFLWLSNHA